MIIFRVFLSMGSCIIHRVYVSHHISAVNMFDCLKVFARDEIQRLQLITIFLYMWYMYSMAREGHVDFYHPFVLFSLVRMRVIHVISPFRADITL